MKHRRGALGSPRGSINETPRGATGATNARRDKKSPTCTTTKSTRSSAAAHATCHATRVALSSDSATATHALSTERQRVAPMRNEETNVSFSRVFLFQWISFIKSPSRLALYCPLPYQNGPKPHKHRTCLHAPVFRRDVRQFQVLEDIPFFQKRLRVCHLGLGGAAHQAEPFITQTHLVEFFLAPPPHAPVEVPRPGEV